MTNLRFVITGGPGAGKTTILNALAERGYRYAAESARAIIRERLASGLSLRPPLAQFGNEILRRDIARYWETRVTDHPVFFDRGIVDALCVLDQQHAIALGEAEAYVRLFPYNNVVLLMPPWEAIYRTDAERDQTFAEWCTTWYMREETLEAAFTHLVNYHHKLPLSQVWGSGILSSSDGQRFPVSGKNRHARVFPPPLGYGQGLTFYSWTSDQLSQYGSKPVSITARDATYVLDAILGNETELAVVEHTTDTAGATEMIFALFDLLGLRFTPRLRDIGSRRLYRSGAIDLHHYPRLQPHITGRINRQRVLDWWDTMLRAAGSMKLGHVTASLLVQKLQAYPQQNALAQALQEYGRLVRTLHVLRWYANNEDRRRIMRQLNKGEALHDLRAYLMIANKGQLRRKRGDELVNQASCLNLVTNAVILWNTVYMAEAVAQLKREGYPVRESDLPHIWPTRYEHINVYGRYHFNIEEAQRRKGLRPLRQSGGNLP